MSEYQFARACAMAWFGMNNIPMKESATSMRIAKVLRCWDGKGGASAAKQAIIRWHESALTANKSQPVEIEDFYSSQAWRKARYEALKRSRGVCELCGSPPTRHALHVDHIAPKSKFPQLALEQSNLQVLCRDCNLGKSNRDSISWKAKNSIALS